VGNPSSAGRLIEAKFSAHTVQRLFPLGATARFANCLADPFRGDAHGRQAGGDRVTNSRPGIGRVCFINGDGVAVLGNDARGDLLPRVATFGGPLFQMVALATNHGNGLGLQPAGGVSVERHVSKRILIDPTIVFTGSVGGMPGLQLLNSVSL